MQANRLLYTCLLCCALLTGANAFGQLSKANNFFRLEQYANAIPVYEKYLEKVSDHDIMAKLAICYDNIHKIDQAASWYNLALKGKIWEKSPELYLNYGHTLKRLGDYRQAKIAYEQYISLKPNDPRGRFYLASCDKAAIWAREPKVTQVSNLGEVNTEAADFGPVIADGELVFISGRIPRFGDGPTSARDGESYLDIYRSAMDSTSFKDPEGMGYPFNTSAHEGPLCFSKGGDTVYMTRSVTRCCFGINQETKQQLNIEYSVAKNGKWKNFKPISLNSNDYSIGHPSLSADGKVLYFASDMPGGYGGTDIYRSDWNGEAWDKPENLGPGVNTFADELFPYYHPSGILFFSSNGHLGYGGLDLYAAQEHEGMFYNAVNLPVNSLSDDFALVADRQMDRAYFSSNRPGGRGNDDIYTLSGLKDILMINEPVCLNASDWCVDIDISQIAADPDQLYRWDLGDGTVEEASNAMTYCYEKAGNYPVKVYAEDGSLVFNRHVNLEKGLRPTIEGAMKHVLGEEIMLKAGETHLAGYNVERYIWRLSDGTRRIGMFIDHAFDAPGDHKIMLTVMGTNPEDHTSVMTCSYANLPVMTAEAFAESQRKEKIPEPKLVGSKPQETQKPMETGDNAAEGSETVAAAEKPVEKDGEPASPAEAEKPVVEEIAAAKSPAEKSPKGADKPEAEIVAKDPKGPNSNSPEKEPVVKKEEVVASKPQPVVKRTPPPEKEDPPPVKTFVSPEISEESFFTVQIAAVFEGGGMTFPHLRKFGEIYSLKEGDRWTRYFIGKFKSARTAMALREQILPQQRRRDAFVVKVVGGKRQL